MCKAAFKAQIRRFVSECFDFPSTGSGHRAQQPDEGMRRFCIPKAMGTNHKYLNQS